MAVFKGQKEKLMLDGPENLNRLVLGAAIKGDLTTLTSIRLDGNIEGTVNCAAKLVIGPKGSIKGNVDANEADIEGQITGDLTISEILILRSTAVINGNIHAKKIVIEEGAAFNGNCNMNKSIPSSNTASPITNIPVSEEEMVY